MQNFDFQRINVNFPRNSYSLIIYLSLITLISVLCFYTPVWSPSKRIWNHHLIFKQVRQATGGSFCFLKKKKKKSSHRRKGRKTSGLQLWWYSWNALPGNVILPASVFYLQFLGIKDWLPYSLKMLQLSLLLCNAKNCTLQEFSSQLLVRSFKEGHF